MSAGDSTEHDELRRVVRDFLSEKSPSQAVRRLMEAGERRDEDVWALLAGRVLGRTVLTSSVASARPSPWSLTAR